MTSDEELFEPLPNSYGGKIRCRVCHASGYPGDYAKSWMNTHRRGHLPCPRCGRLITVLKNGKPRTHSRCPTGRVA